MSDRYDKYTWLELAFSEQVDRLNERFYFDRKEDQFFSVFITDYFLTASPTTESIPNNPYSAIELKTLTARIKRLELHDTLILSVPRLTVQERKQMMQEFLENHPHLKNYDDLQKVIDKENGRTNLNFDNLLQNEDRDQWRKFKRDFIEQKIDTFCNLQSINLDTASLWTDKKMTTVSLGIDNAKERTSEHKKPWWKFW